MACSQLRPAHPAHGGWSAHLPCGGLSPLSRPSA